MGKIIDKKEITLIGKEGKLIKFLAYTKEVACKLGKNGVPEKTVIRPFIRRKGG